ncbi:excalibur calcium-binding domain-containing protein [Streptomyces antimicrobicus]|uniref:Excalibur calcium-binding domain-containing protein n=1 Tax=Streptomyces antimicrobicus TaxID=2883108 RepID=A0ABS8BBE4_9ACTN|nr:excalibur calcium-binding domain-containing protein [Streptomyces antimicrobicus]MCB5181956.1 excalibur calcium-binding domain-containing protein [Streptomyces antimicrobicus]
MAGVAGVLVVLLAGCGGSAGRAGKKGGNGPAAAAPSASAKAVMPALVGQAFADAEPAVVKLTGGSVEARSAYGDVSLAADHAQWSVCFQTPAAGSELAPKAAVELSLAAPGTACPEQAGAPLKPSKGPSKAPATPSAKAPTKTPDAGSTPGKAATTAPAGVYYKTCAEARAAGAAPIRRGQPGYGKHLDRDNDGIACDK